MSSIQDRLQRLEAWLDKQNARDEQIAKARPTWWHAGKVILGALFVLRSVALAVRATDFGDYALALMFLAGGAAFVVQGAKMLRRRWLARAPQR